MKPENLPTGWFARQRLGEQITKALRGVTADSIDKDEYSNVKVASSPEDIQSKIDELPPEGGRVVLQPGVYEDDELPDTTVSIPGPSNDATYELNCYGSKWVYSSATPDPIFERVSDGSKARPIDFTSPVIDGSALSNADAGTVAHLRDYQNSKVWIPYALGEFDVVLKTDAINGSGHGNHNKVFGKKMDKGVVVEAADNAQTDDRSFYYGQLTRIGHTGIELKNSMHNHFYIQPENARTSTSGTQTAGYRVRESAKYNTIHMFHRGCDDPLDIRAPTRIVYEGGVTDNLKKSKLYLRPEMIDVPDISTTVEDFSTDALAVNDNSSGANQTPYSSIRLDAGTSDTNTEYFASGGRLGNLSTEPWLCWGTIDPETTSSAVHRFGLYRGAGEYAMFVGDADTNANWQIEISVDGAVQNTVDTGVSVSSGPTEMCVNFVDSSQTYQDQDGNTVNLEQKWWIDNTLVATTTFDTSGWNNPLGLRADLTVSGSPSSNRTMEIKEWQHGGGRR